MKKIQGEFIDSETFQGWHKLSGIDKSPKLIKFLGMQIYEDENYIILAQAEKYPFYGNILKIPKKALITIGTITGLILLIVLMKPDIKDAIFSLLP